MNMPLLSRKEEKDVAIRYKLGCIVQMQIDRLIAKHDDKYDIAMVAEHFNTTVLDIRLILHNKQNAGDTLVKANIRLAIHIAKSYRNRGVPMNQLVVDAVHGRPLMHLYSHRWHNLAVHMLCISHTGLTQALPKFDVEKGFRFSTLASFFVRNALAASIAQRSSYSMHMPSSVQSLVTSAYWVRTLWCLLF